MQRVRQTLISRSNIIYMYIYTFYIFDAWKFPDQTLAIFTKYLKMFMVCYCWDDVTTPFLFLYPSPKDAVCSFILSKCLRHSARSLKDTSKVCESIEPCPSVHLLVHSCLRRCNAYGKHSYKNEDIRRKSCKHIGNFCA